MPRHPPGTLRIVLLAMAAVVLAGCPGDEGNGARIQSVEVTSAIDTVIPIGFTAQLSARAIDSDGNTVSGAGFDWASSASGVASVSGTGEALGVAAGQAQVTATVRTLDIVGPGGTASGSLPMHVLDADVEGMRFLLDDPVVAHITGPLGAAKSTALSALADCDEGLTTGHLMKVIDCLETIRAEADGTTDGHDRVLLNSLALVTDLTAGKLNP